MIVMKTRSVQTRVVLLGVLGAWMLAVGCRSGQPKSQVDAGSRLDDQSDITVDQPIVVSGPSYQQIFVTARDVLRDYRFAINRVDAARGVLTTYPKRSVGVATPWDREQSSIGQDLEDFANQQERTVRIEFAHVNGPVSERVDQVNDQSDDSVGGAVFEQTQVRVIVELHRVHRPNWRVETESIRLSTHAKSRDSSGRIEPESFRESIGVDEELGARIRDEILRRVSALNS